MPDSDVSKELDSLRRRSKIMNDALATAHVGIWEWEKDETKVVWSDELYRIYGVTRDQYSPTYNGYLEKIHPDDRTRIQAVMNRVFNEHISFSHDERIVRPDGSVRHLHTWGHPQLDEAGNLLRLVGVCQDVTERKKLESELSAELSSRELILSTVKDLVFYLSVEPDGRFRFLSANRAFLQTTGLAKDKVIGQYVDQVIPEPVLPKNIEQYRRAIELRHEVQWDEVSSYPSGVRYGEVTVIPLFNDQGGAVGLVGSVHDITERVATSEKLKRGRASLERIVSLKHAIIESTADGILAVDSEGMIVAFNHRLLSIWGLSADQLLGKSYQDSFALIADRLTDPEACMQRLAEIVNNPEIESYDAIELTNGGVLERYSRPQKVDGITIGRVFSYRDVTDRVRAEARDRESIRMRDDFIQSASHELRTPLAPLKLQLELLSKYVASGEFSANNPRARDLFEIMEKSERHLSNLVQLVDDMFEVSRLIDEPLKLNYSRFDLRKLVEETSDRLRSKVLDAHSVIKVTSDYGVVGHYDRQKLERMLALLISNAIRFGAGKPIQIHLFDQDGNNVIVVRDFGIGIPKEDQARMFGRFQKAASTGKFSGLGLGLYYARQIVQAHGGRISFESVVGGGTSFVVELPKEISAEGASAVGGAG